MTRRNFNSPGDGQRKEDVLPTPKFEIGQVVFRATTRRVQEDLPCPDCLGSKEWIARSPAGFELKAPCPRCASSYRPDEELRLDRWVFSPVVNRLTIGSIQINTNSSSPVEYMCRETGVGSGQVYDEATLFADHDTAMQRAIELANDENSRQPQAAEAIKAERYAKLDFPSAQMLVFKNGVYQSWNRYRALREDIENLVAEGIPDDIKEKVEAMLDWDRNHRDLNENLLDAVIRAARDSLIRNQDERLQAALDALPFSVETVPA